MKARIVGTSVVALLLSVVVCGEAQTSMAMRIGVAEGTTTWGIAELSGRTPVLGSAQLVAGVQLLRSPVACSASWPESFQCGYGGNVAWLGSQLTVAEVARASILIGARVGIFRRTNGNHPDPTSLAWGGGADLELPVSGRLSATVGVHHSRIRDRLHKELFGESVHATAFAAGLGYELQRRGNSR